MGRSPEGECGSLTLLPGWKRRGMESGRPLYHAVPDGDVSENQLAGRGSQPAATDFLGTLEMLSTKRCGGPSLTLGTRLHWDLELELVLKTPKSYFATHKVVCGERGRPQRCIGRQRPVRKVTPWGGGNPCTTPS